MLASVVQRRIRRVLKTTRGSSNQRRKSLLDSLVMFIDVFLFSCYFGYILDV